MPPALVEDLRAALANRKDVKLALLFGSRARDRFRPDSDVDVAYLGKDVNPLELAYHLGLAVRLEVQAVDIADASYPLMKAVLRDGILLHQGEPGAGARWRSHAIAQLETDRPWFERMRDAYLKRFAEGRHG